MQAIEVIVLLVFTIMAAGLITGFIFNFDFLAFQKSITSILLGGEKTTGVQKVSFNGLLSKTYDCWQKCLFGAIDSNFDCGAFHLQTINEAPPETLTTARMQQKIVSVNFCEDCNVQVSPPSGIQLPAVLSLSCEMRADGSAFILVR